MRQSLPEAPSGFRGWGWQNLQVLFPVEFLIHRSSRNRTPMNKKAQLYMVTWCCHLESVNMLLMTFMLQFGLFCLSVGLTPFFNHSCMLLSCMDIKTSSKSSFLLCFSGEKKIKKWVKVILKSQEAKCPHMPTLCKLAGKNTRRNILTLL